MPTQQEDKIAQLTNALNEVIRLYQRSNKKDKNTCYQMYLVAAKILDYLDYVNDLEDKAKEVIK